MLGQSIDRAVSTIADSSGWGNLLSGVPNPNMQSVCDTIDDLLTAAELTQVQNIDSTTISADQWGYLGALDQALATTDSPTFATATVTTLTDGTASLTGGQLTGAQIGAGTPGSATGSSDLYVTGKLEVDGVANIDSGYLTVGSGGTLVTYSTTYFNATTAAIVASNYPLQFRDSGLYIYSPSDSILQLSADGYVRIGSGTTGHSLAADGDFLVSGTLEVDSFIHSDREIRMYPYSDVSRIRWMQDASNIAASLAVSHDLDQMVVSAYSYAGYQLVLGAQAATVDYGHAAQSNPTLFVHGVNSPATNPNEWWSIAHNQTNAVYTVGTGTHVFQGYTEIGNWPAAATYAYVGNASLNHSATGNFAIIQNASGATAVNSASGQALTFRINNSSKWTLQSDGHMQVAVTNQLQFRDSGIYIYSPSDSILQLSADGYVRIGSGTTSHALAADGNFLVSGILEVDGGFWFDTTGGYLNAAASGGINLWFSENEAIGFGLYADFNNDQMLFATRSQTDNQIVLTTFSNYSKNHDHGDGTNPILFFHDATNPDTTNNKWGSLHHDGTHFRATTGANTGAGSSPATIDNGFCVDPRGTNQFMVSGLGNVVCGNQAALATDATDGFLYVPTCAGAPTGVPTAYTGKVAVVFDTTNNKLYVYDGGWIATAALT